jgi:hypothetical protein
MRTALLGPMRVKINSACTQQAQLNKGTYDMIQHCHLRHFNLIPVVSLNTNTNNALQLTKSMHSAKNVRNYGFIFRIDIANNTK